MLPLGSYRYEIRLAGALTAVEEAHFDGFTMVASRRSADGLSRHEVTAKLDDGGHVERVALRYTGALFTRKASYTVAAESLRGSVSALAGQSEIVVPLGRFRELDVADLVVFRALLLAHLRSRGQTRWTGRVAVIDANTLVAASLKQSCMQRDSAGRLWSCQPHMSDTEEVELDDGGRIVRRGDTRGLVTRLILAA